MSGHKLDPFPCRNPESFSKFVIKTEIGRKKESKPVIHRNVEGENNGEFYKIKGPKIPDLLSHLETNYVENQQEDLKKVQKEEKKKASSSRPGSSGTKREYVNSSSDSSDDELNDPNVPSTSSQASKKRQRNEE